MTRISKRSQKFKEWFRRYMIAEILGTVISLIFAYVTFTKSHSYLAAAASGFVGEGIGFFGYFLVTELTRNARTYRNLPWFKKLATVVAQSGTNLIIEFAPAEILDNIFVRPFLMFFMPQHIHPYAFGFVIGKLTADVGFYTFAIIGYELKKKLRR